MRDVLAFQSHSLLGNGKVDSRQEESVVLRWKLMNDDTYIYSFQS